MATAEASSSTPKPAYDDEKLAALKEYRNVSFYGLFGS